MIGGVVTFIKNIISMNPGDRDVVLVGINSTRHELLTRYHKVRDGREYEFIPVISDYLVNRNRTIPASLKYIVRMWRKRKVLAITDGDILCFQRMEYVIPFLRSKNRKVVFLHNQIRDFISTNSESKWKWFQSLYWLLTGVTLKTIDRMYFVERNTMEYYKKRYPRHAHKFFFCPTMFDDRVFTVYDETVRKECIRTFEEKYGAELESKDIFLFVGRFEKQKNPELLVEVIREYLTSGVRRDKAVFVLAGDGSYREFIEKGLEPWIKSRQVILTGALDREEIARWMNAAFCMLLTSHFEGMPIAVLEAMGCGALLVSTDVGEIRNMVRENDNGVLVGDFSVETYIKALEKVAADRCRFDRHDISESVAQYRATSAVKALLEQMEEA